MTKPSNDEQRILIVEKYRASGLTQEAFCEELRTSHGFNIAARTLRAWCSRLEQPTNSTEACVQIVTNAIQKLQDVVKGLQAARSQVAVPVGSQVAAGAASLAADQQTASPGQVATDAPSSIEAPEAAISPTPAQPAAAVPSGMPGGNTPTSLQFMPVEEVPAPEKPRRPKGRIIWEV